MVIFLVAVHVSTNKATKILKYTVNFNWPNLTLSASDII